MTWMGQSRREFAVVGQEQQSFAVVVETPHGIDVFADAAEQIDDRLPPLRVRPCRDDAGRLVEQDVAMTLRRTEAPSVNANVVCRGIGLDAHFADRLAVDRDAALLDQLFSGAARGDTSLRKNLLKANT